MIKYFCDRCGKDMTISHEHNKTADLPKLSYLPSCKIGFEGTIEVCHECITKYVVWLKGDKIDEE